MAVVKSQLFASDPDAFATLSQVVSGTLRLGQAGTGGFPPVVTDDFAVGMLQQALARMGFPTPSGATNHFGPETATSVANFKAFWSLTPADGVAGRRTISALDYEMLQLE